MLSIRALLAAATVAAVTAVSLAAPASAAGACDQQGRRFLVNGVWHKAVRVVDKLGRARWVDCGAANAF